MSKSLFSVTPNPLTGGGIFSALQSLEPPWEDEDIALQLDLAYYGNISGGKVVSPLIDRLLTDDKLTTLDMATLAGVLMATNKKRWSREWATRSAEYDPIENYRMTEEMTDDETVTEYGRSHTRTDNLAHTETRTDNLTRTIDNQEITTPNLTSTSQQATRGFNSSSDVNTDKETATNTGTNRVDTDGTEHNTGTQGTTGSNTGTQTDADTGSDTSTRNYTLTRSGNIGVTTSQQMLQSERDLWMWSYFYDVVFPDVDEVLTVPIYADSEESGTGGGVTPTGTISINANGSYNVTNYATASVNVPQPDGSIDIVTNGRHDVTSYEYADVLVPNSYTEVDEGKVVSDGSLVSQSDLFVTSNGTYNTTLKNRVFVSGPVDTVISRADWDELTITERQGLGMAIIVDSDTGFSRGDYVDASQYNERMVVNQSGTAGKTATVTVSSGGTQKLYVLAMNQEAVTKNLTATVLVNGVQITGTTINYTEYNNNTQNKRNSRLMVFEHEFTAGDSVSITIDSNNVYTSLAYIFAFSEDTDLYSALSTPDAGTSGSAPIDCSVIYGSFAGQAGGEVTAESYTADTVISVPNPGINYKSSYIFWLN